MAATTSSSSAMSSATPIPASPHYCSATANTCAASRCSRPKAGAEAAGAHPVGRDRAHHIRSNLRACTRRRISTDDRSGIADWQWLALRVVLSEAISSRGLLIRRQKPQRDAQAGTVVGQLDAHAMKRGDRFDQTEAKSASRRAAAAFQPIKALKHTSPIRDRNSWPAIHYGDGYRVGRLKGHKPDGCSCGRMLHRVLD